MCVYANTHALLIYEEYMTVHEEFASNLLACTHHFEQEALLGSIPCSYCIIPPFFHVLCSPKGLWRVHGVRDWWHQTPSANILQTF